MPLDKFVIGVPLYGLTYTLAGTGSDVGARAYGPASKGPFSAHSGVYTYYEVSDSLRQGCKHTMWNLYVTVNLL